MATEHRNWPRGRPTLRRYEDPAASADPRISALVEQLRTLPVAPAPRAEFRDELRAQLVAITPRIVAESAAEAAEPVAPVAAGAHRATAVLERPRPTPRASLNDAGRRSGRRGIPFARPLAAVAALVTICALVLGGAVFMSQDTVPGDSLYGLKRASERFELSLADNDTERAQDHLDFARSRVDEARQLAGRPNASAAGPLADGPISSQTGDQIAKTLADADSDTRAATQLLGTTAVNDASATPLAQLVQWLPSQRSRLTELSRMLPKGSKAQGAATRSVDLVQAVDSRAKTLQSRVGCKCLKNSPTDSLGPLPYPGTAGRPGTSGTSTPSTSVPKRNDPSTGATNQPGTGGSGNPTNRPAPGNASTPPPVVTTPHLPKLPLPLPTATGGQGGSSTGRCYVNLLGIRICTSTSP